MVDQVNLLIFDAVIEDRTGTIATDTEKAVLDDQATGQ